MKRFAPATERNREPIARVLRQELPTSGLVLEVASGSGEHAVFFARRFPDLLWQPSDPDEVALASIESWREEDGSKNLLPPMHLDASSYEWPIAEADAIFCANMVHISPPEASEGLFAGAGRLSGGGSSLILYGPFLEQGVATAASNLSFDESLKARNPAWGLRNVEWMDVLADANGFRRKRQVAMPANNLMLIYRKG